MYRSVRCCSCRRRSPRAALRPSFFVTRVQTTPPSRLSRHPNLGFCLSQVWRAHSSVLVLTRQSLLDGLQHCCEEPDVWLPLSTSSGRNSVRHVVASMSLIRDSSSTERFMLNCIWEIRSSTSASSVSPFASSSPPRCCFIGMSFCEALLLLGSFFLPGGVSPACCPPKDIRTSFMVIFGQSPELGKQAHLF